jgi:hypothetical protein
MAEPWRRLASAAYGDTLSAVRRLVVCTLILAAALAAAAPLADAVGGKVTVRMVGMADGKGTFTAKGALGDSGTATASPTRIRTAGAKGVLTFQITGRTWRILVGTKAYKGLYGHGVVATSSNGSIVTLTGTVERPRQPVS